MPTNGWGQVKKSAEHNRLRNAEVKIGANTQEKTGWVYIDVLHQGIYTCIVLDAGKVLTVGHGSNQGDAYDAAVFNLTHMGYADQVQPRAAAS